MSNETNHPLKFTCYKCGRDVVYPKYLKEDQGQKVGTKVIKRCTTCAAHNEVSITAGWVADSETTLLKRDQI